ncbi:hypothetical protein SAN_1260, partial [Streptococcus agalactiae COH1]
RVSRESVHEGIPMLLKNPRGLRNGFIPKFREEI